MKSISKRFFQPVYLFSFWLLLSGPVSALESDVEQPITVEADSMDIDDGSGTSVYRGNVELHQGTLTLKADKVTVIQGRGKEKSDRVVAEGKPAILRQLPDGKTEYIEGRAQRMEYSVDSALLLLIGKASLRQGKDNFKSDRITYDRSKAMIRAGKSAKGNQRVKVTISSKPKNDQ
jgi:lipopolysaccharide export system protein LptA